MNCGSCSGPMFNLPMFVSAISTNPKTQEKTKTLVNINQISHIEDTNQGTKIHYVTSDDEGNMVGRAGLIRSENARVLKNLNIKA